MSQDLFERLRAARWPGGIICPRCGSDRCGPFRRSASGAVKWRCRRCARTFTDLTGTPLARSRLPLATWLDCARLMRARPATCAELSRKLGVRIATAWRLRKGLARAMSQPWLKRFLESAP